MATTNKTADGLRRVVQLILLVSLAAAVVVGVGTAVRILVDNPLDSIRIIAVVLLGAFVVGGITARFARRVPKGTVLELDLGALPPEAADTSLAGMIGGKKPTMRETVDALSRAAADSRVAGLLVHATFSAGGVAQVQELRDAFGALRTAGKFTVAYSDSYNNGSYHLASACDEVLLQPTGDVDLRGLAAVPNFYKGALDKLGIEVEAEGRWEYKSAADQVTRTRMSRPFKESHQRVLDSIFGQIVSGVAQKTHRSEKEVRALIDAGPFLDKEAEKEGLVDALMYRDQAIERAKTRSGPKARLLDVHAYAKRAKKRVGKGRPASLAIITATGPIVSRRQGIDPIAGRSPMESDKVAEWIRKAVKDKRVKAIVMRVDSPGGSAVASEAIWRETVRAKEKNKPVVVSMGNVAASGGYYISAAADCIVAHPGTITGSIGVISAKPVLAKAKRKLGVHPEELKTSAHAAMMSVNRPFSESEKARFEAGLDDVYATFTSRVAEGRGLDLDHVLRVARGRVWTGEDAHEHGLVDELGGLTTAIGMAKQAAGVKVDAPVRLVAFPKKQSPLARIRSQKRESSDLEALVGLLAAVAGPVQRAAADLGLLGDRGVLHCGLTEDDWLI